MPTTSTVGNILTGIDVGSRILGGLAGGKTSSADRARQAVLDQQALLNAQYEREANARALQMANLTRQQQDQMLRAQSVLWATPLGGEQNFVTRQRFAGSLAQNLMNAPESSAYGGVINPVRGMDLSSLADPAIAQSLAEQRKAIAGINPNFQFGAMGAYGLTDTLTPEQQVSQYARDVASQRMTQENALTKMLNAQFNAAQQMGQTQAAANQPVPAAQPEKKKTSIWKKIAKVGLAAAPIVAAPFTGGTSLALIGAGAGAASGALDGGWKGALTGGATGALAGGLGGGAGAARGVAGTVKESAGSAIKRAILNPRALAQIGSAALPDQAGQAVRMASMALPGAKASPLTGLGQLAKQPAMIGPTSINLMNTPEFANMGILPSTARLIDIQAPNIQSANISRAIRPQGAPKVPALSPVFSLYSHGPVGGYDWRGIGSGMYNLPFYSLGGAR